MTVEYRELASDAVELRSENEGMNFRGYTSRYGSPSEPLPFIETVEPGAWTRSLKARNEIKSFVNHNTDLVLGSTRSGTLQFTDDERGLLADISLPETTYGRDLAVSVKRGDVSGMSVGMSVVRDEWSSDYTKRRIIEARLHEASVVTGFPAFRSTTATVRALAYLAHRTEQDVDALADAFDTLQAGQTLTDEQYGVLLEAADRSRVKSEEPAPEAAPVTPLAILSKKLDLIGKSL
jgi:HK97 family phage prohead protease